MLIIIFMISALCIMGALCMCAMCKVVGENDEQMEKEYQELMEKRSGS